MHSLGYRYRCECQRVREKLQVGAFCFFFTLSLASWLEKRGKQWKTLKNIENNHVLCHAWLAECSCSSICCRFWKLRKLVCEPSAGPNTVTEYAISTEKGGPKERGTLGHNYICIRSGQNGWGSHTDWGHDWCSPFCSGADRTAALSVGIHPNGQTFPFSNASRLRAFLQQISLDSIKFTDHKSSLLHFCGLDHYCAFAQ